MVTAKTELDEPLPSNYKPVLMFCSEDELESILSIIKSNVCADVQISHQTKELLRKMFSREEKKKEFNAGGQ